MAKLVKKKKKRLGGRSRGGGTSGKKITPLRPYRNPQTPPCQPGCPIGNDVRGAIAFVGTSEACARDYDEAFKEGFYIFAKTNPFPAITGRLCTACCMLECNRQHKDGSVVINKVERFLGDLAIEHKLAFTKPEGEPKDGKTAVIGAGPSGMACAYHLAMKGWQVTVFDAADGPGGFLRQAAPFRLPRAVLDAEIQRILDLGVELRLNTVVGTDVALEDLQKDFKAIYVATGAYSEGVEVPDRLKADNTLSLEGFMSRLHAGETDGFGNDVVVLGGGNAALDVARACKRLGANATVVFRRTQDEMSAFPHEVAQAEAEGVEFEFLAEAAELVREGDKGVKLVFQRLKPGPADGRKRYRPLPVRGETLEKALSTLVIGQIQEPGFTDPLTKVGLPWGTASWGGTLKTQVPGVFGGGDANRLGHVTVAIGQGRIAAEEIDAELTGAEKATGEKTEPILHSKLKMDWYKGADQNVQDVIPVEDRLGTDGMNLEATVGLSRDNAIAEAKRCFSCGLCMDCDNCWMYCQDNAVEKTSKTDPQGEHYYYKHSLCTGCEKCAEECPCHYLIMQ